MKNTKFLILITIACEIEWAYSMEEKLAKTKIAKKITIPCLNKSVLKYSFFEIISTTSVKISSKKDKTKNLGHKAVSSKELE